jgi:Dyp-type peroxidase family
VNGRLEPVLETDDIQGNILGGFSKDYQTLAFLMVEDAAGVKRWLRSIHGYISSTSEVLRFNRVFRSVRARTLREPIGLSATWCNIAFSRSGIEKLTSSAEADGLPDDAFREGMPARAVALLGDPADAASPFHPDHWRIGATGNIPDAVLIVASDQQSTIGPLLDALLSATGGSGLRLVVTQDGAARADQRGHEHFGFKDGISQPGVRGRASSRHDDFITPRLIDPADPLSATHARPGQPLIMPGQFVLGYDTQSPMDGTPQAAASLQFSWYRNGSFLVFRRLRQDVAAFRSFVSDAAATLARSPGFSYVTPDLFASLLVGRWPDGSPITRAPGAPTASMAQGIASNAFAFTNDMPAVALLAGVEPDAIPSAPADPFGTLCPHWAHIRKVNPRDDVTDLGDEFDTLTRRMLRRGIPYGDSLPVGSADDGRDRGLLFLAYHASIEQSFERLTSDWLNKTQNPNPDGHDPIIGQTNAGGSRVRRIVVPSRTDPTGSCPISVAREWVLPTGGGYFFAPSVSALVGRLAS